MNDPLPKVMNANSLAAKKQPVFKAADNYMEKYKTDIIAWY